MPEPSNPSSKASSGSGVDSLSPAVSELYRRPVGEANRRAVQSQMRKEPTGAPESIQNLCADLMSSERIKLSPPGLYSAAEVPARHQKALPEATGTPWGDVRDKLIGRIGSGFLMALIGPRGPGKTQLAEQVIRAASAVGRPCLYVRAMEIFLRLRASFKSDALTELEVIQGLIAPKVLVIDEIQERGETAWEDRVLSYLMDRRYGDMGDTLLIANLTKAELRESLGPSISDRIRESGGVIECNWASFRTKTAIGE